MTNIPTSSIFAKQNSTEWEFLNIIHSIYISNDGNAKRKITLTLRATKIGLHSMRWVIPLQNKTTSRSVYGIRTYDTQQNHLIHRLSFKDKDHQNISRHQAIHAELDIHFTPLQKGEVKTINIEYYLSQYALPLRRRLLKKTNRIEWFYYNKRKTDALSVEIHLPQEARFIKTQNLTLFKESMIFNGNEIRFFSVDLPEIEKKYSEILEYDVKHSTANLTIGIIISLILAGMFGVFLTADSIQDVIQYSVGCFALAIFAFLVINHLLPGK